MYSKHSDLTEQNMNNYLKLKSIILKYKNYYNGLQVFI